MYLKQFLIKILLIGKCEDFWNYAKDLIKIRKGELDLQEIIDKTDQLIIEVEDAFKNSSLPESINRDFVNNLLVDIRKQSIQYFNE
jgi:hypothetical protein